MHRSLIVGAAVLALSLATAGVALAQPAVDPITKGVPTAQANAACLGIVGKERPAGLRDAVAVYNTVNNTDDAPFSAIPVEWQKFVIATEDHKDYLAMSGLDNSKAITCRGATAVFPALVLAKDITDAVCKFARLDLIAQPALRARVETGLKTLSRSYGAARSDCPPVAPAPTTTPVPATTTAPPVTTTVRETEVVRVEAPAEVTPSGTVTYSQVSDVPTGGVDTGA